MMMRRAGMACGVLACLAVAAAAPAPARAGIVFYSNNAPGFGAAVAGQTLLGTETFEESATAAGGSSGVADPLAQGVANGPFLSGLAAPLTVQSNTLGGNATAASPRGTQFALINANRSQGATSNVVVSNRLTDSTDLIFRASDLVTAVGFDAITLGGSEGDFRVSVYDLSNRLLSTATIGGDAIGTNFLGVVATGGDAIGRINLFSASNLAEGADNISIRSAGAAAIPEPASLAMTAVGVGLAAASLAIRRR